MDSLKSKLQYNFFEIGEFISDKIRNWDETADLIKNYPWDEQRNGTFLTIELTGPSITIEGKNNQFLKIALYHYGWFIIYWINDKGKVFLKVVEKLEDVISNTQQFFENRLSKEDFKSYDKWIYKPLKHFETKTFEYKTTLKRSLYLVGLFVIIFIFLTVGLMPVVTISSGGFFISIMFIVILFLFSVFPILLFFNYYYYSKKLFLKVSRCNDEFEFGKIGSIKKYNKQEIRRIKEFSSNKANSSRGPIWSSYSVFVIEMKNGEFLKFTSLMFSSFTFAYKFPEQKIKDEYLLFPTFQKASFVPLILS